IDILGTTLPIYNLFILLIGPAIAVAAWLMLTRSAAGRMVRAAALDREMLGALGANVGAIYTGMFCVSSFLAGLSGALVTPIESIVPGMDVEIIVEAFIVVVIGGGRRVCGDVLGFGDLRPSAFVWYSCLSKLFNLFGVCINGRDPHHPPLGAFRSADPMRRRGTPWYSRFPWMLVVFLAAFMVPWLGSRYDT